MEGKKEGIAVDETPHFLWVQAATATFLRGQGRALASNERPTEAVQLFSRAIALAPRDAATYLWVLSPSPHFFVCLFCFLVTSFSFLPPHAALQPKGKGVEESWLSRRH